jgi:hypothetical protein
MKMKFILTAMVAMWIAVGCTHGRGSASAASDSAPPPPPQYSAGEIGVMFDRPTTAVQLLKNIKMAVDRDLVAEPGLFTDENLLKFFAADTIRREAGQENLKRFDLQETFLTATGAPFSGMSVQVEQGLVRRGEFDPGHFAVRGPIRRFGYIHMNVGEGPDITVGDVREVFGRETQWQYGGGWATHGGPVPDTAKGSLYYGTTAEAFGKDDHKELSFVIKPPAPGSKEHALPPARRDRNIYDADSIVGIFVYVPQP